MAEYLAECIRRLESFAPEQGWAPRRRVVTSENGKSYVLPLVGQKRTAVYKIDGEAIVDGRKCDKLVLVNDPTVGAAIFVELKGKDIEHAIGQLEATMEHPLFRAVMPAKEIVRARIVTAGCGPASDARKALDKAKIRFVQKFGCDLRIIKSRQPDAAV